MIKSQKSFGRNLRTFRYSNGQIGVFIQENDGQSLAELSIMNNSIELEPDEFILKDYSENEDIAEDFIESLLIVPTNRYVLIGAHLCPICRIEY